MSTSVTLMQPVMSHFAVMSPGDMGILLGHGLCAQHAVIIPEGHAGLMNGEYLEERVSLWKRAVVGIEVVGWFKVRIDGCWLDSVDLRQKVTGFIVIISGSEIKAFQLNDKQRAPFILNHDNITEERYRQEYLPNRHLYHEIPILFKLDH